MALIEQTFPGANQNTSSDSFTVEQIKGHGGGSALAWQNVRTPNTGNYTVLLEGQNAVEGRHVQRLGHGRIGYPSGRHRH